MSTLFKNCLLLFLIAISGSILQAQTGKISGRIMSDGNPVIFANVYLKGTNLGATSDTAGVFNITEVPYGDYKIIISTLGYATYQSPIHLDKPVMDISEINLVVDQRQLGEVVVSGTMKEVTKMESPVPVEVYTAKYFERNPTPSIFEAIQQVNGVRPQINCSVCNTGDIHINGLEGPYTMVLVDGMPIVSGLSTVYGMSGIPQDMIERVEVVKGPASTLYGSEAVGGLINIVTKKPQNAPLLSADVFATSWGEVNSDITSKLRVGKKAESLLGINYFNYSFPIDNNNDGFTDVTQQNRVSIFNKWNFNRKENRVFSLAARYIYEDRWGGDLNWTPEYRGGDSIYGESIYTNRWEIFGTYQFPTKEEILFQFSASGHDQNSVYGNTIYKANQNIGFSQMVWHKKIGRTEWMMGSALRYTYYDDNTPATASFDSASLTNQPSQTYLPGIFVQNELSLNEFNKLLIGIRYDYNSIHGSILTPRLNYKWNSRDRNHVIRLSFGNGYRVANVFTEDHAALTGTREVVFNESLAPETSWNGNINAVKKLVLNSGALISLDATVFYTYFGNKIVADYESDPQKIIYQNLSGHAVSQGASLNFDLTTNGGLMLMAGVSYLDVFSVNNGVKEKQLFTETFSGVWNVGYTIGRTGITIDYTGNVYSPMRLPLLGPTDPRSEYSPWYSIQNVQVTKAFENHFNIYAGVKNLLNWTPNRNNPFIISRTNDPFDKGVLFDTNGQPIASANNPYALTFDPAYVYAPNQGIRFFIGFKYRFDK